MHYLAVEGDGSLTGKAIPTHTKYYYFNGQRVAMRKDGVVYYTVGDHLGTTSLVLDGNGDKVAESRHYPYGEERWSDGTLPTDYRFTGQREEAALGLYHMGARFYDPALGRWLSADTIVPGAAASSGGGAATLGYDVQVHLTPLTVGFHEMQFLSVVAEENREIAAKGSWFQRSEREKARSKYQWGPLNPQALNRYAYCLGNPLRYVDPTGHDNRNKTGEVFISREMIEWFILYLSDIDAEQARWLGGGVFVEAGSAVLGWGIGSFFGMATLGGGIGALAPIAAWIVCGGWDAGNLGQLSIKLQLLLKENPEAIGFWMTFYSDYNGWVTWIHIYDENHEEVKGWWSGQEWGLSSMLLSLVSCKLC